MPMKAKKKKKKKEKVSYKITANPKKTFQD